MSGVNRTNVYEAPSYSADSSGCLNSRILYPNKHVENAGNI